MVFAIDALGITLTIPDVVLSGLLASAITLTGVMFSDWRNTRRQEAQQRFTEREAERSRMLTLRKEVYLPVAGEVSKMQGLLLVPPSSHQRPEGFTEDLAEFDNVLSKVATVGTTHSALLAQKVRAEFGAAFTMLTIFAAPLIDAHSKAMRSASYRDEAQKNLDRITAEIAKVQEAAEFDDDRYRVLERSQLAAHQRVMENSEENISALRTIAVSNMQYTQQALKIVEPLSMLSVELLSAIRSELGVATDLVAFTEAMNSNRAYSAKQLALFFEHMEAQLKQIDETETDDA